MEWEMLKTYMRKTATFIEKQYLDKWKYLPLFWVRRLKSKGDSSFQINGIEY